MGEPGNVRYKTATYHYPKNTRRTGKLRKHRKYVCWINAASILSLIVRLCPSIETEFGQCLLLVGKTIGPILVETISGSDVRNKSSAW